MEKRERERDRPNRPDGYGNCLSEGRNFLNVVTRLAQVCSRHDRSLTIEFPSDNDLNHVFSVSANHCEVHIIADFTEGSRNGTASKFVVRRNGKSTTVDTLLELEGILESLM